MKINIDNWRTPVVSQYKIRGVPHCMIYDPAGQLKESSSRACFMVAQRPDFLNQL